MKYDICIVFVALLLMPDQAQAYIDPGIASMAIQAIIAAIAGGIIAIRRLRKKIVDCINVVFGEIFRHGT